jgi:hypothetical protein
MEYGTDKNTKSFLKAGITNALEGSEYKRLWAEDKNEDGDSESVPESSSKDNNI